MAHLLVKSNPLQEGRFDYAAIPILKKVIRSAIDESQMGSSAPDIRGREQEGK
jgi:hypothetical protein